MKECRLHTRLTEKEKFEFDKIQNDLGYRNQSDFIMASVRAFHEVEFINKDMSILNQHILRAIEGSIRSSENRLGNRFSKLMAELIIEMTIQTMILKMNHYLTDLEIQQIRLDVVAMLKASQSVIKYSDLK